MNGWVLFFLIIFVLGIVISNIMLLKHTAKMKLPESVMRAIEEKKSKGKKQAEKKPTEE